MASLKPIAASERPAKEVQPDDRVLNTIAASLYKDLSCVLIWHGLEKMAKPVVLIRQRPCTLALIFTA